MKDKLQKLIFVFIFLLFAVSVAAGWLGFSKYRAETVQDVKSYIDKAYAIERAVVEHLPIYEDFSNSQKEASLRTHLLQDHLAEGKKTGIEMVQDEDELKKRTDAGEFKCLESGIDKMYYFYSLPEKYRCLAPHAVEGLNVLLNRFQENLNRRAPLPVIKLAISSAIRPISYQQSLRGRNGNASMESSHSYGISFDIFYDDFLVGLPPVSESSHNAASKEILEALRPRLAFLMGDALSRQFRAVLMETLIQLQDEGILYAILETNQRCYHITILKK